jgi:hypothetical protein
MDFLHFLREHMNSTLVVSIHQNSYFITLKQDKKMGFIPKNKSLEYY